MNGPFVVAQANTGGASATPVQVLKLIKPKAGETDIMHASFTGTVKIDFTAIANEPIVLYHDRTNQSLRVIFADGSQIIIEPFFFSDRGILGNLLLQMGPNEFYSGEEFAQKYDISEDPSVLPAAGAGGAAGGADFHDASVDPLGLSNPLGLLGPEELPGLNFTITEAPVLQEEGITPVVSGHLQFIVEEEELRVQEREQDGEGSGTVINSAAGNGNEDTNDVEGDNLSAPPGNDEDVHGDFAITQKQFSGDISGLVSGGGPFTFFVNNGADGAPVLAQNGVQITSLGDKVVWEQHGPNDIWGVTVPDGGDGGDFERTVFILHLDSNGHFTLELTDQIDHDPAVGGTPTDDPHHDLRGSLEETIFLDLSIAIGGTNTFGIGFTFPPNTVDVGVIDDTPIVKHGANECVTVDEDDIKTHLSHGTSPNDGDHDGSFTGSPFSNGPGPATVCGDLSGLVRVGADAVYIDDCGKPHGTFSFVSEDNLQDTLQELGFIGLSSKGYELEYELQDNGGSQTLVATAASGTEGGYERTVFTLEVFADGKYEFKLFDQLDHDPPHDFFNDGVSEFPGADQNFDLQDTVDGDVSKLNFGGLIQFSDYDHDTVGLDGAFEIKIRDDVPEVKCDPICLTVDEDDIVTNQSLGSHPKDGDSDGSSTGSPFNPFDDGPATVIGKLGGLFGVVETGADEPLTFSFITDQIDEHIVESGLALIGLKSQGEHISYDFQGDTLFGFVDDGGNSGYQGGEDRLVFAFQLQSNGNFKFELFDQLDHDPPNDDANPLLDGFSFVKGSDENIDLQDNIPFVDITSLNFGALINATDFDGDSVNLHDQLVIKIRDDVPERAASPTPITAIVQEDGLSTALNDEPPAGFLGNDLSDGNRSGGETTSSDEASGAAGSFASFFISGADEPLTFGLSSDTSGLPTLFSKGDAVHYLVLGNTLTGFAGIRPVFTLTVNSDGSWSFDLDDQLDHIPGNGDAGFDLRTNASGTTSVSSIDFSSVITATDFDGDAVVGSASGSFTIAIENDVPINNATLRPTKTVYEDGLNNAQGVGNPEAGHTAITATYTTGNILSLVNIGADETGTVALAGAGLIEGVATGAQSKGFAVTWHVVSATEIDGIAAGDGNRIVFKLVDSAGTFTFTLVDQVDHLPVNAASNDTDISVTVDIAKAFVVTDKDGDFVQLDNGAVVAIENDIPKAKIDVAAVAAQVKEDALSTAVEPTDSSEGNRSGGETTDQDLASGGPGSLTTLFSAGADEPVVTGISTNTSGLPHLFSKGEAVLYSVSGDTLTAFADQNGNGTFQAGTDRVVFTLTVNPDGSWSFDLDDQLDHVAGSGDAGFQLRTSPGDVVGIPSIDFSSILTATDFDGDTVTGATAGKFAIAVENDVPALYQTETSATFVTHDETGGLQNAGVPVANVEDFNDNDAAGSTAIVFNGGATTIAALFNGLIPTLDDPDVSSDAASTNSAIGYARSASSLLPVTATPGADEPAPVAYKLAVTNDGTPADGTPSGLFTTEGQAIHLFQDSPTLITGRYDTATDGDGNATPDSDDLIAFALSVDPLTGVVYMAQWTSLDHPTEAPGTGQPSYDEALTLASGTLSIQATLTDFDGDNTSTSLDLFGRVFFEDDGPSLNIVDAPNEVNENASISGTWTLAEGADGVANGVDISVNGGVAQNLSVPNGVLVVGPPTDFEAFSVLGGTLTVFNNGTWTYENGSVASDQSFSFSIKATDGDGDVAADSQTITVHDVVRPVLQNGFSNTVEEEHLQPASGTYVITASGNEDTQDASGLDTDENAPDFLNTITNVKSGNLGVTGGDGTYTYYLAAGIEGSQVQKVGGGGLTSEGAPVLYHQLSPGHFIGYVDSGAPGGYNVGDRVVFAIDIAIPTDSYTFTLYDNVDHPTATSGGPAFEETLAINFNGAIVIDDEAGQSATLQGSLNIIDDTPLVTDSANGQITPTAALALDLDETIQPDGAAKVATVDRYNGAETESNGGTSNGGADDVDPDGLTPFVFNHPVVLTAPTNAQAIGELSTNIAGGLGSLFTVSTSFGADGPAAGGGRSDALSLVLSSATVGTSLAATALQSTALATLSLADRTISLVQVDSTHIEGRIPGGNHVLGTGGDDFVVFRITLLNPGNPATAQLQVDQFLPIDHGGSENPSVFDEQALLTLLGAGTLNLQLVTTVTDGDGDTATSSATVNLINSGTSFLSFDDDGPSGASITTSGTVIHDETPGLTGADPNASNDVAGASLPAEVLAKFNAVHDKGVDPDVSSLDNNAIGFAMSQIVVVSGGSFGTDGPAASDSQVLSLSLPGGDHTSSGLFTTDGHPIFLFKEGDLIVGRYDGGDASTDVTNAGTDPAAFAIAIGNDGTVSLVQYVSLQHPNQATSGNGFNSYDEAVQLTSGTVSATVTLTDGDGDKLIKTVDISNSVRFQDDGPTTQADSATVTPTDVAATVNAFFILDKSGSMGSDGNPNSSISIAKAAILDFASHANVLSIRILPFDSAAGTPSVWFDLTTPAGHTALETFLDPITGANNTNYEDAIFDTQAAWTAPPNVADFTNVYFVSDGEPTVRSNEGGDDAPDGGIGNTLGLHVNEVAAWEAFLTNPINNIDNAFAIGINTSVSDADLQEIAYPNVPDETHNVFIINSADDLSVTLTNTLQGSISGNVIKGSDNAVGGGDDDSFGADGHGFIASLRYDSDGDGDVDGSDAVGFVFDGSHLFKNGVDQGVVHTADFATGHGGDMQFDFLTGGWTYSTPDSVPVQFHELFKYTIVDGDNDQSPATTLDITVNPAPPSFTVSNVTVAEGDKAVFVIDLSSGSPTPIVLNLAFTNGTAEGSDYNSVNYEFSTDGVTYNPVVGNQVTIPALDQQVFVRVQTNEDADFDNETFTLTATAVSGTANPSDAGVATVTDDDTPPAVSISNGTTTAALANVAAPAYLAVNEGDFAYFQVKLSAVSGLNTIAKLGTFDNDAGGGGPVGGNGSATEGSADYATSGFEYSINGGASWLAATGAGLDEVTIPAGLTSILVRIATVEDATNANDEALEAFRVSIVAVTNGTSGGGDAPAGGFGNTGEADIIDDDNPPTITSNGGGSTASVNVPENTTAVTTVVATDLDPGTTLQYTLVNTAGTDFNKFTIDINTGVLAFISAPDFETPTDVGGTDADNTYVVTVQASDGVLTDTQTINVSVTNVTTTANDDIVRTAVSGSGSTTVVPEWAFLHDDTNSAGHVLDITATTSPGTDLTSTSLITNAGSVTIVNNDTDGGSFVYTASDGSETDTASVSVVVDTGTMDGNSSDNEIFVGTSGAETINGNDGDDILIGKGGADTLNGGNGDDVLVYVAGVGSIDGGANADTNLLTAGNHGDILSVDGTVDFTALADSFQNIETISMLASDGSAGNSTITLNITDVLGMADTGHADPSTANFSDQEAIRIDGEAGDVVNLNSGVTDNWVFGIAGGSGGVPAGYNLYSHVTSGSTASTNEDAYVMIATGVTVNLN